MSLTRKLKSFGHRPRIRAGAGPYQASAVLTPDETASRPLFTSCGISWPGRQHKSAALVPLFRVDRGRRNGPRHRRTMYSGAGSDCCDSLGLANAAVGAERGQDGGEVEAVLGVQPPAVIVQVMDARIRAERPVLPEWLGRGRTSSEIVAEFEMLVPEALDDLGRHGPQPAA